MVGKCDFDFQMVLNNFLAAHRSYVYSAKKKHPTIRHNQRISLKYRFTRQYAMFFRAYKQPYGKNFLFLCLSTNTLKEKPPF